MKNKSYIIHYNKLNVNDLMFCENSFENVLIDSVNKTLEKQ
jgi:hypothetical protein